jgi:hypothetical protein
MSRTASRSRSSPSIRSGPIDPQQSPLTFLRALWPNDLDAVIYVLALPQADKSAQAFPVTRSGLSQAARYARSLKQDVYVTVCAHELGTSGIRGNNASARWMPGLWVDFDFADRKPHAKSGKTYPPEREVRRLLKRLPVAPSLVVRTAAGLHAYWLFDAPLEAQAHADLCRRFQRYLSGLLGDRFAIDATGDLARVLRIPGTRHRRSGERIRIEALDGPRHSPKVLLDLVQDTVEDTHAGQRPLTRNLGPIPATGLLHLDPKAKPPRRKLQALLKKKGVQALWQHRSQGVRDPSQSGWDLALAQAAFRAGWKVQEVTDLLIANRRLHRKRPKLREDYYLRTWQRARCWARTRRKPRLIQGLKPHFPSRKPLSAESGVRQLGKRVRQFFKERLSMVICAPCGIGKTTVVIEQVARRRPGQGRVEIYVPRHDLAREYQRLITARNPRLVVQVVGGRTQLDGQGQPLCRKAPQAEALHQRGYPVYPNLCQRTVKIPGGRQHFACEHFEGCPYLAQYEGLPDVVIHVHARLPLKRTELGFDRKPPQLAIIDESCWGALLKSLAIPLGVLQRELGPQLAQGLVAAITSREPLLERLRARPQLIKRMQEALKHWKAEARTPLVTIHPGMADADLDQALAALSPTTRLATLLRVLLAELETPRAVSQALVYDRAAKAVHLYYREDVARLKHVPTLLIDANAQRAITRVLFPDAQFHEIRVERHCRVTQVYSTRGARSSLVPAQSSDRTAQQHAQRRLDEVNRWLARLATTSQRGLVGGPQDLTGNPAQQRPPLIQAPPHWSLVHYNGFRGNDGYKDCATVVVVSRNEPPVAALEQLARSLYYDDPRPLHLPGRWTLSPRGYRTRDGRSLGTEVIVHPDPRCQGLLEQLREGEITQLVDRARLIHAPVPKEVVILCNLVVDLTVDRLVSWKTLMQGGTRWERAWEGISQQGYQVLPLHAQWLSRRFPGLWGTAKAVHADLRNHAKALKFKTPTILIEDLIRKMGVLNSTGSGVCLFEFRAQGQRRWSKCLSAVGEQETRRQLRKLMGQPIVALRRYQSKG